MTEVMTTKKPKKQKAAYPFPVELIDQLLAQVENKDAESILGESGLAGQLKKMLAERVAHPAAAQASTAIRKTTSAERQHLGSGCIVWLDDCAFQEEYESIFRAA